MLSFLLLEQYEHSLGGGKSIPATIMISVANFTFDLART